MKKYLIILLLLITPILRISAEEIIYNNANIKFEIDESFWNKANLSQERETIDKKWLSDCGQITSGEIDIYEIDESSTLSREQYNYKNLLTSEEALNSFARELSSTYTPDGWKYVDYNMRFIYVYGTAKQNGIAVHYDMYFTINNGYGVLIQYHKVDSVDKGVCKNTIEEIVSSAKPIGKVKGIDDVDYSTAVITLLIGLVLTIICYEIYPFICIKIKKKRYSRKEFNKMILWNSIIVGGICFIITFSTNSNATWNAAPACFYYLINKSIWKRSILKSKTEKEDVKKNRDETTKELVKEEKIVKIEDKEEKKREQENTIEEFICDNCGTRVKENAKKCPKCGLFFEDDEEEFDEEIKHEELFKCDNCGAIVNEFAKKCPKCGEIFEEEKEDKRNTNNMGEKYSDLKKLKELLDEKIITKEEFEKEKKKILK